MPPCLNIRSSYFRPRSATNPRGLVIQFSEAFWADFRKRGLDYHLFALSFSIVVETAIYKLTGLDAYEREIQKARERMKKEEEQSKGG